MSLLTQCEQITKQEPLRLPESHEIGRRIMCPEYSKSVEEVKTYPLSSKNRLFALCWNIDGNGHLSSTIKPSDTAFCYTCNFTSGDKTQLHTHNYLELAYIVAGEFHQKILGKDITFQTGELCLIDKNCLHQDYLYSEPATILFLGIANEMFDEIMDENVTTRGIISFLQSALQKQKDLQQFLHFKPHKDSARSIEPFFSLLLTELSCNDKASFYICKGLLMRIFQILSTEYDFSLSRELQKKMNWIMFEEITQFIQKHYSDITIQTLVDVFHFQEDYFNRLIKLRTGMTYSEYVQQIRLTEAERLLKTSTYSIEQIAELVGYQNKGYFYKIFEKKFGLTPSRFRKSNSF